MNKYEKENPFVVPEHYFDRLPDRIMQRVGRKKGVSMRTIYSCGKWAAVFLLGFVGGIVSYNIHANVNRTAHSPETFEVTVFDSQFNPTCDEIIEYLVSEVDDYETLIAENN